MEERHSATDEANYCSRGRGVSRGALTGETREREREASEASESEARAAQRRSGAAAQRRSGAATRKR
jgi:hypothetical protein